MISRVNLIFMVGIFALGVFYQPLKMVTGGGWRFLIAGLVYVLVLRVVAERLGKR